MKILNLNVENIKRIKAIDITPKDNSIVISGKNGHGKSSIMDSIAICLGGKKLMPSKPVRDGEETAKITVDIGDYIVTRHWTNPTTSYLKLENKDGATFKSAQSILNNIIGELSFDPLTFTTIESSKRINILKEITGLDFTLIDNNISKLMIERRDIGKDGERVKNTLETQYKDVNIEECSEVENLDEIRRKKQEDQNYNSKILLAKDEADRLKTKSIYCVDEINELNKKIKELNNSNEYYIAELNKRLEIANNPYKELSKYDEKIEQHYEQLSFNEKRKQKQQLLTELEGHRNVYKEHDKKIKSFRAEKEDQLFKANFPISGLSFGTEDVLFNDIPFNQLSMAEQIKISMSIAIAMNPKLRVVMIYDGSLLDEDSLKYIHELAIEKNIQVWIERVSDEKKKDYIYIEDGIIK